MELINKKFKSIPAYFWVLLAIILAGAFLRTYNLREWLEFRSDQTRDAYLVGDVLAGKTSLPLLGPYMSYSGAGDHSEENSFHLGPIYYYFQIFSAKIFGNQPYHLAFPDVFFSILSIPLFFLFLRVYFGEKLSLGIVVLYAFSAYFIGYSRFAWNSNLIPFFVLLFLFSLYKFLASFEKKMYYWAVLLGFAWGVGFQVHAIIMVIFSCIIFLSFLFSMKKNPTSWMKWVVVGILFIVLNASQIISEMHTGFSNAKTLFNFSSHDSSSTIAEGKFELALNDANCTIEANAHFLSYYGSKNCSYGISKFIPDVNIKGISEVLKNKVYWLTLLASIIFSFFGYFLMIYYVIKEKKKDKKLFLSLIVLYAGITFLFMIPLSSSKLDDLRYFIPIFFVPYMFIGFIFKFISEKLNKKYVILATLIIFPLLIFSNVVNVLPRVNKLVNKDRTCSSHYVTLGELEPVADYIITSLDKQKNLYIGGNSELSAAIDPVVYLLKKQGFNPVKIVVAEEALKSTEKNVFFISCKSKFKDIYNYEKIDNIYVYKIKN